MRVRPVIAAMALALGLAIGTGGCAQSCPVALLTGVLVAESGELVVISDGSGQVERIIWPSGWTVREQGDTLVVTDLLGTVKARQNDLASLGGGELQSGTWTVCGTVEAEPPPAT